MREPRPRWKTYCSRKYLMLVLICVVSLLFVMTVYPPSTPSQPNSVPLKVDMEQNLGPQEQGASALDNTELVKVIVRSGLLSKLSKAILALDPEMTKQKHVLESLKKINFYTLLNSIMEGKSEAPVKNTADVKEIADADSKKEVSETESLNSQPCKSSQLEDLEKIYHVSEASCDQLFSGDQAELTHAVNFTKSVSRQMFSPDYYLNLTKSCGDFRKTRGYFTCPLTSEEENFPIAFSLVIFKDIEMVERLLRSIYRPHNYYCIHVDKKADTDFLNAISAIASCLPHVFLAPERIDVQWGQFSVLEPELVCMEHLWSYKKWKYFINLTGQEFPLKTNWELVQILKAYNGANDLEGTEKRANKDRWSSSPPHNLRPVKGSVHITVNRDFVDFILHNQTAKDLLEWVKHTSIPDETFFATLNHNPQLGIRGTYKGEPETESGESMVKPFLTRFKNWGSDPFNMPCAGQYVRGICILTAGDLPQLKNAKHLFANKFYLWEDPIVIGCLEEMLYTNTRDELNGVSRVNTTYYSQLGFVLNQVT